MTSQPAFRAIAAPLPASDADLSHINQRLGVPSLVAQPEPLVVKPRAPVRPLNVLLPDYVMRAIKDRAHAEEASVRYIVLKALQASGIDVLPVDMVEDARRSENKAKTVL